MFHTWRRIVTLLWYHTQLFTAEYTFVKQIARKNLNKACIISRWWFAFWTTTTFIYWNYENILMPLNCPIKSDSSSPRKLSRKIHLQHIHFPNEPSECAYNTLNIGNNGFFFFSYNDMVRETNYKPIKYKYWNFCLFVR